MDSGAFLVLIHMAELCAWSLLRATRSPSVSPDTRCAPFGSLVQHLITEVFFSRRNISII